MRLKKLAEVFSHIISEMCKSIVIVDVLLGAPQGSHIGPILFCMSINAIEQVGFETFSC